ncbi:unnamed protein product [Diamesa hyperborea]
MCGYLKKKRNRVGGWSKLYFVLQNGLLMSYASKEEYEKKLASFKDVISLIPGNTVLLPSLEPRFTIASNLNTFYTFRCDDNRVCSKWITAILECLAQGIESMSKDNTNLCSPKNFFSQENLIKDLHIPALISTSHSWENLQSSKNWLVNDNGRILLELNYMNSSRHAKLPIAQNTAKMLQNCSDDHISDLIHTTKKIKFISNDENHNNIVHQSQSKLSPKKHDEMHFRLHDEFRVPYQKTQSHDINRINRIFTVMEKSESLESDFNGTPNGSMNNIEEQVQHISLGDEFEYSISTDDGEYKSVDPSRFHNKLNIEEFDIEDTTKQYQEPVYATINLDKKYERRQERLKLAETEENAIIITTTNEYEDLRPDKRSFLDLRDCENIYELVDLPASSSRRSRSLVWKNWKRIHLFDFTKRFKDNSDVSLVKIPSSDTISKREKSSLTFSDFSKRFNYRSMRNKAKKICTRNPLPFGNTDQENEKDSLEPDREIEIKPT